MLSIHKSDLVGPKVDDPYSASNILLEDRLPMSIDDS